MLPSDGWNGILYVDVYERIPVRIAFIEACSEEPSDLLCDRVQVKGKGTPSCSKIHSLIFSDL